MLLSTEALEKKQNGGKGALEIKIKEVKLLHILQLLGRPLLSCINNTFFVFFIFMSKHF